MIEFIQFTRRLLLCDGKYWIRIISH